MCYKSKTNMGLLSEAATTVAESDVTRKKLRLKVLVSKPAIKSSQLPQVNCLKNPSVVDGNKKLVGTKVRVMGVCKFSKQVPKVNCGLEKSSVTLNPKIPVVGNRKLNSITGLKRRAEEVLEAPKPKRLKMDRAAIVHCQNILAKLMNHKLSNIFLAPVNPAAWNIDDYFDIIKKPMDLGTIKQKLQQLKYIVVEEFEADVRLTFSNAMLYNPPCHCVHECAKALVEVFDNCWKPVQMKLERLNKEKLGREHKEKLERGHKEKLGKEHKEKLEREHKDIKQRSTPCHLGQLLGKAMPQIKEPVSFSAVKIEHTSTLHMGHHVQECKRMFPNDTKDKHTSDFLSTTGSSDATTKGLEIVPNIEFSPSKALRVAQMKSRFAETILKAQRHTLLEPGGEADKTIWQQEKESLQRKQHEEKARIEARIRAAKSAARLNEESELKRKRQEAREEARMAIRKMERSVNIDDNYQVLKDLESLMGTSLVVVCNDRRSLATMWSHVDNDILRSPLERLGLFIKEEYSVGDDDYTLVEEEDLEEGEFYC
ncbi:hypothetical protein SOVF_008060 [Spinacia oleracea]|uniref:Transcription factor GTE9-like n=1 Tax=Spinacia oleracea TaxID=3562 RepID=A0A9R0JHA6_SPIOL|nr:transcription factor GTE9-like [Spinacia oleracea]XP_021866481.1 transcription factor GTE9-like [Spinacia oleracea]KNA25272.1 hypothetical protein SOVF_008060 [Spinacia oleracea]